MFARISGLKVNFEKCILIPIGFTGTIPDYFHDSGFKVADSAKILGFDIYNNVAEMVKNFDTVITKLISIRNFWTRFNLSLPGRIAVAKTLMLSQLGYMGCILDPEPAQMDTIGTIIYTFIKGKLNVAKNRITIPVEYGGLGMIDLHEYLTALRCTWVKRAALRQEDLWSTCLSSSGVTKPDLFMPAMLCPKMFPVLSVFESAIGKFASAVLMTNNNIVKSRIKDNPVFGKKFKDNLFTRHIFEAEPDQGAAFENLTVENILNGTIIKTKAEIEASVQTNILVNTYTILHRAVSDLRSGGILQDVEGQTAPSKVLALLTKPKKGSRMYRNILTKARVTKPVNMNIFKKFCTLTDTVLDHDRTLIKFNARWNLNGTSNKLREFTFKFCNNLLGLNSRVSHFNRLVSDDCTFCSLTRNFPAPRETFLHIFYHCPETSSTLVSFEQKYLDNLELDTAEKRRLFWFFGTTDKKLKTLKKFFSLTTSVILFYVWDCKLRKSKQSLASCLNFYFYHMEIVRKISPSLREEMTKINLDLCRYWDGERPRGW
jgi:hypothetical protein